MSDDEYGSWCGRGGHGLFGPLLLIGLGVIFLLSQFQLLHTRNLFAYFWPLILILFGFELLSRRPTRGRLFWGVGLLFWGSALVLQNLGYWAFDIGRLWPLILIVLGLSLLLNAGPGSGGRRRDRWERRGRWRNGNEGSSGPGATAGGGGAASASDSDGAATVEGVAVLGGVQRRITSQQFRGGRVTALFGGFQIDLSGAEIAGARAVLEVSALFGGGEVRVPPHWIVDLEGQALLGGYSDETRQSPPASGAKRLVVQGTAVFGGVVVKN